MKRDSVLVKDTFLVDVVVVGVVVMNGRDPGALVLH